MENSLGKFSPDKTLSTEDAKKATERKRAVEISEAAKRAREELVRAISESTTESEVKEAGKAGQERDDQRLAA